MILTDKHIEAIKTAALAVDFGKITITSGTDNHLDIIVEHRIRLPKEPDKSGTATLRYADPPRTQGIKPLGIYPGHC